MILAAPFVWRRYRKKAYAGAALVALPIAAREASRRIRSRRDQRHEVRDRMVDPLPGGQRSGPAAVPEAFVESGQRDTA